MAMVRLGYDWIWMDGQGTGQEVSTRVGQIEDVDRAHLLVDGDVPLLRSSEIIRDR